MGKAFDVGQPGFEFLQDFELTLDVMLCAKAFGDLAGLGVWTADITNGTRREHKERLSGPFYDADKLEIPVSVRRNSPRRRGGRGVFISFNASVSLESRWYGFVLFDVT